MYQKIAKLIDALQEYGIDVDAEDVADWLWYSAHQNRPVAGHERTVKSVQDETSQITSPAYFPNKPEPSPSEKDKKTDIFLPDPQTKSATSGNRGLPFRIPGGKGLPHTRQLMQALRPLRRRIPAPSQLDLDEEATVQQIADLDICFPVIKPDWVRWLDVMLVIDSAPSMAAWQQTVVEFRRMLEQQGAFRDIRVWKLRTSGKTPKISLYAEKGHSARHYKELINPAQPRLILVVTDCVSPAWTSAKLIHWLEVWGREHPVTLVQVLPQRLWAQTRLRMAHLVRVTGRGLATPNRRLQPLSDRIFWKQKNRSEYSPLPLICLEPDSLAQWTASLAGATNIVLPGFRLRPNPEPVRFPQTEMEVEDRLRCFRAVASPLAFKLACFLAAAAPLHLSVMRMIQRALLPESHQVHLAEFLLSGLIRRVHPESLVKGSDGVIYDFVSDSVRDKLLDAGLITDAVQVQVVISKYIVDNYGSGVDFLGLVKDPTNICSHHIPAGQEGFAKVTAKIFKRLGKQFDEVVRFLEGDSQDMAKADGGSVGSGLPESLWQLTNLRSLNLSRNWLKSISESLAQLKNLEFLDLSSNQLANLPESLGQLVNLRSLNLSHNRLTHLPVSIGQLMWMESLDLSANQLTDLPLSLLHLERLKELNLNGNPLNPELAAAYRKGLNEVKRYLHAQNEQDQVVLNEAKLILVGEGEVGKSSLLDALRDQPWTEHASTHGVQIEPVKVIHPIIGKEITLNAWDFGGQRVYRPTHQLFFSDPAVFLVVWKPREGPQQGFVKEWIRLVIHREPNAKIIVVATHGGPGQRQPDIDRQEIWDLFGRDRVCDFFLVESRPDEETGERRGIAELKDAIALAAYMLPGMGRIVPARWQGSREALKQTSEPYLSLDRVLKICREYKMDADEARLFVTISHRLGHLIHYEHDPALRDIVVLKPDWLATAISFVLDDQQTRSAHGLVSFARLGKLWNDPARAKEFRYPPKLHPIFLRLMERFDLSYRVAGLPDQYPSGEISLIVQLVPDVRPDPIPGWSSQLSVGDTQQVQICQIVETRSGQSAAAEGLFYQLIVRLHKYSLGRVNYNDSAHWQRGLVLDDDYNGRALLEHTGNDIRITVRAAYPESFLSVLTHEVKWLVESFWAGLRCDVMVPCLEPRSTGESCIGLFEVRKLIENKRRNRLEQPCPVCNEWQSIDHLLRNAPTAQPKPIEELLSLGLAEAKSELSKAREQLIAQPGEFLRRFDGLDLSTQRILSQADANFTALMQTLIDEAKEGPRLFSIQPIESGFLDLPKWVSQKFRVTLWCEHSRVPLTAWNGENDKHGVYELELPRDWFVKAAPFLKILTATLSLVLPMASSTIKLGLDDAAYKRIEKELDFAQKAIDSVGKGLEKPKDLLGQRSLDVEHGQAVEAQGAILRQLQVWLKAKDPGFGGLVRVQNKRHEFLWVHPRFEAEY